MGSAFLQPTSHLQRLISPPQAEVLLHVHIEKPDNLLDLFFAPVCVVAATKTSS